MLRTTRAPAAAAIAFMLLGTAHAQQLGGTELRQALHDDAAGFWIYDDIDAGYQKAEATGKPLLVSFRCVP